MLKGLWRMKNYFLCLLLSVTSSLFACDKCRCPVLFDIIVFNNTDSDCTLEDSSIESGMFYSKHLPIKIITGLSESYQFMYDSHSKQTSATLSFQCGNDKFTTFRSERLVEGVFRLVEKDKGDVTAMSNLDPVFTIKKSTCDKAPYTPSAIYWTLK